MGGKDVSGEVAWERCSGVVQVQSNASQCKFIAGLSGGRQGQSDRTKQDPLAPSLVTPLTHLPPSPRSPYIFSEQAQRHKSRSEVATK